MPLTMHLAIVAWLCLCVGLYNRHRPRIHSRWMLAGIGLDLSIVVYLQYTQSAVQTALSGTLENLRMVHIGFSALALLLYAPVLILGTMLLRGKHPEIRRAHIRLGSTAFVARTIGFVFMFFMLD